jgi:hypothetical protein
MMPAQWSVPANQKLRCRSFEQVVDRNWLQIRVAFCIKSRLRKDRNAQSVARRAG